MFSGPSRVQFLSYIPVDEDFVIGSSDSSLKLESDLGPLRANFGGSFQWRGSSNELDFSFTKAQVKGCSVCELFLWEALWYGKSGKDSPIVLHYL